MSISELKLLLVKAQNEILSLKRQLGGEIIEEVADAEGAHGGSSDLILLLREGEAEKSIMEETIVELNEYIKNQRVCDCRVALHCFCRRR